MGDRGNTNYLRRGTGAFICGAPVFLLAVSIAYGTTQSKTPSPIGYALVALGTIVATLNLYLSFGRYFFYRLRHCSADGYRHISGFPFIGTILVVGGGLVSFGSVPVAVLGLMTMVLDTGGTLWYLVSTWRDSTLWDE